MKTSINKDFSSADSAVSMRLINQTSPLKVLYITTSFDAPFRYRCFNYMQLLRGQKQIANIEKLNYLTYLRLEGYSLIVLFRLPWNDEVAQVVSTAKKLNIPVAFDIDDYIFNPQEIEKIPFFKNISPIEQMKYKKNSEKLWKTFSASDFFFGSSSELVDLAEQLGKKSFLLPNLINPHLLKFQKLKKIFFPRRYRTPIISYFSGSNTHDMDFEKISPAICKILEQHLNAYFLVVGFLKLNDNFKKFDKRIIRLPFLDWELLPWIQALVTVNLAPLSEINTFSNAKSALKFFEAAAVKVPTIATPTREMKKCIINGENGFFAETNEDWFNAINFCLNRNKMKDLGQKAYDSCLSLFSFEANTENTLSILKKVSGSTEKTPAHIKLKNEKFYIKQAKLGKTNFSFLIKIKNHFLQFRYLIKIAFKNLLSTTPRPLGLNNPLENTCSLQKTSFDNNCIDIGPNYLKNPGDLLIDTPSALTPRNMLDLKLIDQNKNIFLSQGLDPYFLDLKIPAGAVDRKYFLLKMVCKSDATADFGQIFWLSDLNDFYKEEYSIRFPVVCDGKVHTYFIRLDKEDSKEETLWKQAKNIYKMRLDPISSAGTFKILEMKFTNQCGDSIPQPI